LGDWCRFYIFNICFLWIGIGFGFTIVYQHCKGTRHGYENLC
jgi:hypothetical protein